MLDSPAPVLGFILSLSSIGLSLLAGLLCAMLGWGGDGH